MKIRKGFVTNSSSSSYVCEICSHAEEVYDSSSTYEQGFYTCENGHSFCTEHAWSGDNIELLAKFCANKKYSGMPPIDKDMLLHYLKLFNANKERGEMFSIYYGDNDEPCNLLETLKADAGLIIPEEKHGEYLSAAEGLIEKISDSEILLEFFCPICNFSHVSSDDVVRYAEKKLGSNNLREEIMKSFESRDDFKAYLKAS